MNGLIPLSSAQIDLWAAAFVWPFIRILALLATAPIFDNRVLQRRLRIGLAAALAILISPVLPAPPSLNSPQILLVLLQQILIGISMGFFMRLIFAAFEVAGDILGLQMGLAFAQVIDPGKGGQTPLVGSFLGILASLLFLTMDGHLLIITALIKSFEIVPISDKLDVINFQNLIASVSWMFMIALHMSLPVLTAVLVSNIVLGILSRAAPQLNIMAIGFSITITTGLWMLWITLPWFINSFDSMMTRLMEIQLFK